MDISPVALTILFQTRYDDSYYPILHGGTNKTLSMVKVIACQPFICLFCMVKIVMLSIFY